MARAMKDSGIEWIGIIPSTWSIMRAKYVFEQKSDRGNLRALVLLSPTQKYGVIPQNMYEELSGFSAVKLSEKTDYNTLKTVHKGAFVISLRSFQGGFEYSEYEGVVSPAYQVFYPQIPICDGYYKYLFKTKAFIDKMNSYTLSLRDGKNIAFDDFGRTYISVPPIEDQRHIAQHLDEKCAEIDALIADVQTQIETLEQYKRSVITEAVTKGLNPNVPLKAVDSVWITEIPATWQFMKAGYLFVERSVRAKGDETPLSLSQKDGLVITDEMTEHAMKSKTYDGWKKVWVNDLVLNRFKAHLGVFFCSKYYGMVSFHYGVYVPISKLNVKFYEYLFHSKPYCEMFADLSNGITVGLQNLGNANFYSAKCVYPSPAEQDRIVEYLDTKCAEIDAIIDGKRQQLAVLEEYKKSVIFEYVTGKKEVPVA